MFSRRLTKSIALGAAALAIGGGAYGIVSATASNSSATATTATAPPAEQPAFRSGGSNARSGPAAGGTVGTVDSVSTSSFTLTTVAGQKVTVTKASATTSVKKDENVLVLGTVNGTTIIANTLVVHTAAGSAKSSPAGPLRFPQDPASTRKQHR